MSGTAVVVPGGGAATEPKPTALTGGEPLARPVFVSSLLVAVGVAVYEVARLHLVPALGPTTSTSLLFACSGLVAAYATARALRHQQALHLRVIAEAALRARLQAEHAALAEQVAAHRQVEEALRAGEQRFRMLVERSPEAIALHRDGRLLFANAATAALLRVRDGQALVGRDLLDFVHPHDRDRAAASTAQLALLPGRPGGDPTVMEYRLQRTDGALVEVEALCVVVSYEESEAIQTVLRDVTARRRAERAVRESAARLRAMFEQSAVGMVLVNLRGIVLETNPAFQHFLGYPAEELRGRSTRELSPSEDATEMLAAIAELKSGARDHVTVERRYLRRDQRVVWGQLTMSRVDAADGRPRYLVGMVQDVTARKQLEDQLTHQAFHDPLTGLSNRALFRDRVEHAMERAARGEHMAVLFLDLDDFKTVNDSLGHAAGDQLLRVVAERLTRATRGVDTVARLGGDEFAVLLESMASDADAMVAVERIASAVRRPITVERRDVLVRASIGVAHARGGESADELLRNADVAMYRAKDAGKGGHVVFEQAMHAALLDRLELEADLRRALEEDELHLLYQPVVELATGRVAGVETLLRWRHPRRGLVSPVMFVPVAEETGTIVAMGRWVLRHACLHLQRWQSECAPHVHPTVSVNLSGRQLQHPSLVEDVAAMLAESGARPDGLILEITESVIMQRTEDTLHRLHALKSLGVRLAIDDFGTGYSSLGYLQRFPIDILKIDKAFVDGVARGGSDAALTRTIIALGDMFRLQTVAEGVEDDEQRRELVMLGCPLGQGFLFAPPLEVAEISRLLVTGAAMPLPLDPDRPARRLPTA